MQEPMFRMHGALETESSKPGKQKLFASLVGDLQGSEHIPVELI
jgi:hypothetical protein